MGATYVLVAIISGLISTFILAVPPQSTLSTLISIYEKLSITHCALRVKESDVIQKIEHLRKDASKLLQRFLTAYITALFVSLAMFLIVHFFPTFMNNPGVIVNLVLLIILVFMLIVLIYGTLCIASYRIKRIHESFWRLQLLVFDLIIVTLMKILALLRFVFSVVDHLGPIKAVRNIGLFFAAYSAIMLFIKELI